MSFDLRLWSCRCIQGNRESLATSIKLKNKTGSPYERLPSIAANKKTARINTNMSPEFFDFEWNEEKAKLNITKHGVDFKDAAEVFSDPNRCSLVDERREYGEVRWIELGQVDGVVLVVAWTPRDSSRRIISARKAKVREVKRYENGQVRAGP
jgi:uncharacterized DUF497 family protein